MLPFLSAYVINIAVPDQDYTLLFADRFHVDLYPRCKLARPIHNG